MPRWTLPVTRPDDAPAAPGRRRAAGPGTRLSTPTIRLATPARPLDGEPQQPVGRDGPAAPAPRPRRRATSAGRRRRSRTRATACRASPSISVTPPRKCRLIELHRACRSRRAIERVRDLVQQHREVEQHREGEAGDVLPDRRAPGCDLLDPRRHQRRRSAPTIRNHESTTRRRRCPRCVPSAKRAGRRGSAAPAVGARRVSDSRFEASADSVSACRPSVRYAVRLAPLQTLHGDRRPSSAPRRACSTPRRRRRRARLAVAEPGQRLHVLPAALPLPHHRPAARAALARRRARHGGPQGAGGPLRPAGRRAHPRAGHATCWCPSWERAARGRARARRDVRRADEAARPRDLARQLPRACSDRYFTLEDPQRLEPAERELYVETLLDSGLLLRGFVDRLDVAPTGEVRVVDYKTGRSPGEGFEAKALFQMKFYALVVWRTRGVVPRDAAAGLPRQRRDAALRARRADLLATERKVEALWEAIRRAEETGDWRPEPEPAVRLVRPPGDLPGVGRHTAAAAGRRAARRRRSTPPATLVTDAGASPAALDASAPERARVPLGPQRGLGAVGDADRLRTPRSGAP